MRLGLAVLAATLACAAPALADHRPEVSMREALNLRAFADTFPNCQEWTDGCASCRRTHAVHCSKPGVFCRPGLISCTVP